MKPKLSRGLQIVTLTSTIWSGTPWLTTRHSLLLAQQTSPLSYPFQRKSQVTYSSPDNSNDWDGSDSNSESSWSANQWESEFSENDDRGIKPKTEEDETSPALELDDLMDIMSPETQFIQADERVQTLRSDARLTEQQIALVAGNDLNILRADEELSKDGTKPAKPAESDDALSEKAFEQFQEATNVNNEGLRSAKLGKVDSHELVELDDEQEPFYERFVFVDEHSCIGCTMCAGIAQATFMMEDEHGRARVYQQQGDADSVISEAIETCPVNCIHYVPWPELVSLEARRRNQVIDFFSILRRTEQGTGDPGKAAKGNGALEISGNSGARCNNCPGNGCKNCPMFSVGGNPEYIMREMKKKKKREGRAALSANVEGDGTKSRADL